MSFCLKSEKEKKKPFIPNIPPQPTEEKPTQSEEDKYNIQKYFESDREENKANMQPYFDPDRGEN